MVTGFDILFFWVARMIVFGLEMTGQVPFRQVHLHGLVRDADRQKMSKTKGNVVDPLTVNDQYGTDAVRLSLVQGAASGMDISFTPDRMEASRSFANKIWNAARFIFMKMEAAGVQPQIPAEPVLQCVEDRWIHNRLRECISTMNSSLQQHRYHEAADAIYHFLWDDFCDWYIELKKLRLRDGSGYDHNWQDLLFTFESALRLLHPIMPFLTEELWQRLRNSDSPISIALGKYPSVAGMVPDAEADANMATLQTMITAARTLRAELVPGNVSTLNATLYVRQNAYALAEQEREAIERLANIKLELLAGAAPQLGGALRSTPDFDLVLQLPASDMTALRNRLQKEIDQLGKAAANSERQLSNAEFIRKAPEQVVSSIRAKLADYEAQLSKSRATLEALPQ